MPPPPLPPPASPKPLPPPHELSHVLLLPLLPLRSLKVTCN